MPSEVDGDLGSGVGGCLSVCAHLTFCHAYTPLSRVFLVCAATPAAALATLLGLDGERLDFTSVEAMKGKAT